MLEHMFVAKNVFDTEEYHVNTGEEMRTMGDFFDLIHTLTTIPLSVRDSFSTGMFSHLMSVKTTL